MKKIALFALCLVLASPMVFAASTTQVPTAATDVANRLGQGDDLVDANGNGTLMALTKGGAIFVNIATATTTVIKTGAGVLHKVCINTYAASGTITIYNNTAGSGAKIATVTNPATLLAEGPNCAVYDAFFSVGLTVVTTSTQDITVTYR